MAPFRIYFVTLLAASLAPAIALAQQTNNSSSLTNSAAPSASSVTTGGTNINYQNNNSYNNDMGFAPGVFCRTPTLYVGGNWGEGFLNNYDPIQRSGNNNLSYSFNAGLAVPIGSKIIDYCNQLAAATARDREISSQLSMLRTCAQLEKEGLAVDPELYPLLKPCVKKPAAPASGNQAGAAPTGPGGAAPAMPVMKPKTTRVL